MAEENHIQKNLQALQNKIVDFALIAFSSIATIVQVITLYRAVSFGKMYTFIIQTLILLLLVITAFFRKRLSFNFKILTILVVTLMIFISGLYSYGYIATSIIYVSVAPVFVSFIASIRNAKISLGILVLTYLFFGFLYCSGYLGYSFDVTEYIARPMSWLNNAVAVTLTSAGLFYIGYYYRIALIENYTKISEQNIALTDSENKYRTLFERSNDAIVLIEKDVFVDCNENTFNLFTCEKDFIINKTPANCSPELQPDGSRSFDKFQTILSGISDGNPCVFDWQFKRPDGSLFDVSISLNTLSLDNTEYTQAIIRDITEKKIVEKELENHRNNLVQLVSEKTYKLQVTNNELTAVNKELKQKNEIIYSQNLELNNTLVQLKNAQIQLAQSEKMASLGILTAGVAHEINNPLNFILGGYTGLQNYFNENQAPHSQKIPILMEAIETGLLRISSIVKGLSQFSIANSNFDGIVNIHSVLDNCLLMLGNKLNENISIEKTFTREDVNLKGNLGELHQALLNILTNAFQSIESSGKIVLHTEKEGNNIVINISDTGCGIPQEILPKITDPFFTTREPGSGTGLGLSISYAIIKKHNGKLEFLSNLNSGTTVKIILPNSL